MGVGEVDQPAHATLGYVLRVEESFATQVYQLSLSYPEHPSFEGSRFANQDLLFFVFHPLPVECAKCDPTRYKSTRQTSRQSE
jgi:hypothetical protein